MLHRATVIHFQSTFMLYITWDIIIGPPLSANKCLVLSTTCFTNLVISLVNISLADLKVQPGLFNNQTGIPPNCHSAQTYLNCNRSSIRSNSHIYKQIMFCCQFYEFDEISISIPNKFPFVLLMIVPENVNLD